jgi:hypothetical protein
VQGHLAEAVTHLTDRGAIRQDVASSIVRAWAQLLGPAVSDVHWPISVDADQGGVAQSNGGDITDEDENEANATNGESPGIPTVVRLSIVEENVLLVAFGTAEGYFASFLQTSGVRSPTWRRLASPTSPLSRDIALHRLGPNDQFAVWSSQDGLEGRLVSLDASPGSREPVVRLQDVQNLLSHKSADQIRYPIAACSTDPDILDIFWTTDRCIFHHSAMRHGKALAEAVPLADPCVGGERFNLLGAARVNDRKCVLAGLTDRSRILLATWELDLDHFSSWQSAAAPVSDIASLGLVQVGDRTLLLACTSNCRLFAVDIAEPMGQNWPWWSVPMPSDLRDSVQVRCVGVASKGEILWLAVAGDSGVWILSLFFEGMRSRVVSVQQIQSKR